jgi:hypothetical protein
VGAFELEEFAEGTRAISKAIADSKAFVVAGGGDTLAAIEKFRIANKIDYVSTGGGAFLAYLEGKTLPAIAALENRNTMTAPKSKVKPVPKTAPKAKGKAKVKDKTKDKAKTKSKPKPKAVSKTKKVAAKPIKTKAKIKTKKKNKK